MSSSSTCSSISATSVTVRITPTLGANQTVTVFDILTGRLAERQKKLVQGFGGSSGLLEGPGESDCGRRRQKTLTKLRTHGLSQIQMGRTKDAHNVRTLIKMGLLLVFVVGMIAPSQALTGARQGCLAIVNNSSQEINVYLQGSNDDDMAPWVVPAGVREMLADTTTGDPPMIIVSEQTYVWAETGHGKYPKQTLKADPGTVYAPVKREGCPGAFWLKIFI